MWRICGFGCLAAVAAGLCLAIGGCGQPLVLVQLPSPDERSGSEVERSAAALYALGLSEAWSGQLHSALEHLRMADRLAPEQPLILAAIGFVLDDLAHPEPDGSVSVYYNGLPTQGLLRREELDGRSFVYLNRAAELNIDDERVYERLAAHWHRVSRRPDDLPTVRLTPEDRRMAESLSAHYSFLAMQHLAEESASDISRQKAMVYIKHLRKFFQQRGELAEELAVVQVHRRLEPEDMLLQLDEIELLYLLQRSEEADQRLVRVERQSAEAPGAAGAVAIKRRLSLARRLGERCRAAAPAPDWPSTPGVEDADLNGAGLNWLRGDGGLVLLWEKTWLDFGMEPAANPFGP